MTNVSHKKIYEIHYKYPYHQKYFMTINKQRKCIWRASLIKLSSYELCIRFRNAICRKSVFAIT